LFRPSVRRTSSLFSRRPAESAHLLPAFLLTQRVRSKKGERARYELDSSRMFQKKTRFLQNPMAISFLFGQKNRLLLPHADPHRNGAEILIKSFDELAGFRSRKILETPLPVCNESSGSMDPSIYEGCLAASPEWPSTKVSITPRGPLRLTSAGCTALVGRSPRAISTSRWRSFVGALPLTGRPKQ
jgi:hypothetical protein